MGNYKSSNDASKGTPNLEAMQYLQDQLIDLVQKNQIPGEEKISITASATGGSTVTSIPVGADIVDVVVHATATSGGGTVKLTVGSGGADITDTIACASTDTIARAGTIDQTYKQVTSDGIDVVTNGVADRGDVYVYFKK